MCRIDYKDGWYSDIDFGYCDMIFIIQNHARINWAVKEVFVAVLGLFWGTQGMQIYSTRPLRVDQIRLWEG